jgi:hypothetical protein
MNRYDFTARTAAGNPQFYEPSVTPEDLAAELVQRLAG